MSKISGISCQFCGENCTCLNFGGKKMPVSETPQKSTDVEVPISKIASTAAKTSVNMHNYDCILGSANKDLRLF